MEGAILAERTRQHREMRLKGNAELKEKVEELKVKLQTERERMQEDFEGQVSMQPAHKQRRCMIAPTCIRLLLLYIAVGDESYALSLILFSLVQSCSVESALSG